MCVKDLASLSGVGSPTGFLPEDGPFQLPPAPEPAPLCITGSQSRGKCSENILYGVRTKLTPVAPVTAALGASLCFVAHKAEPVGVML